MARHTYTDEQLKWLEKNRPKTRNPEFANKFNKKFGASIKPESLIAFCARKCWKCELKRGVLHGNTPWNKGMTGLQAPPKAFKKGYRSYRHKDIGHELIRDGDVMVKVHDTGNFNYDYRFKRHVIWESYHGAIKDGYLIRHKDGNNMNFDIDNLEMLSKQENLLLNRIDFLNQPEQLKPALRAMVKLKNRMHELEKEMKQ